MNDQITNADSNGAVNSHYRQWREDEKSIAEEYKISYSRLGKRASPGYVDEVITEMRRLAVAALLYDDDQAYAVSVIQQTCQVISGVELGSSSPRPVRKCICDYAEKIGRNTYWLGLPEAASRAESVSCPRSPQFNNVKVDSRDYSEEEVAEKRLNILSAEAKRLADE